MSSGMSMTALRPVVELELTDAESARVGERIAAALPPDGLDPDREPGILARIGAEALASSAPGELIDEIRRFPRSGASVVVVRNLPRQPSWPASPTAGWCAERELSALNALHMGIVQLMGLAPFAVEYENAGHLMRNVVPNPAAAGTTSSWGADTEFFWHTDNPHLEFGEPGTDPRRYVPRYLTFTGIRNEEAVPTDVMPLPYLERVLDAGLRSALAEPLYDVTAPDSNRSGETLASVPLLDAAGRVRFDRGHTTAAGAAGVAPLARFTELLADAPHESLVLGAGDFLAFDNYRTLHRRVGFTPAPPGHARWLRRLYAG
ncbi:TauD/TfdA family dioxygenase [Streptomyces sp. NPDC001595]|uniref:clavaminate synthase n=1 Tax=Streptomyces sp. NPDC001532 TaxID=3154520 RepID=UPI00332FB1AC